jgi:hypothetical protein
VDVDAVLAELFALISPKRGGTWSSKHRARSYIRHRSRAPLLSNLPTVEVDQFHRDHATVDHRDHATVELAIRDLKEGAGLEHRPSGRFFANAAWLGCAVLAHNLIRWTARLGDVHPDTQLTVTRTVRSRLLALPGRLINRSRRWVLRLPARWSWATRSTPCSAASGHCRC